MIVLTAKVNSSAGKFPQHGHAGRFPIDLRLASSAGENFSGHFFSREAAGDGQSLRTGPNQVRIGPRSQQQLKRIDQQRLAGAGLAREHGEPGPKRNLGSFDDREVFNGEFGQHLEVKRRTTLGRKNAFG
jgi:hypothetical protein